MRNGCWEVRAALRLRASSRRSIRRQARSSHKARGAENLEDALLLPIWEARKILLRGTELNLSGATERLSAHRHWKEAAHFLEKQARVLTLVQRSRRQLSCNRARKPRLYSCSGRQKAKSRLVICWDATAPRT